MPSYLSGSSSVTRLELHVCFKVKYCHTVFDDPTFTARCAELLRAVGAKEQVLIKEMGFDRDHVHMVWQVRVTHRLDQLAKAFKGTTGKALLAEFPTIKRRWFWRSGLWSGVIFADSIGRDPEQIAAYVRNQGKPRFPPSQTVISRFTN